MIMKYGVRLPGLLFTLLGTAGMLLASVAVRTRAVWLYYVGLAPCVGLCIGVTFFIAIQVRCGGHCSVGTRPTALADLTGP